MISSSLKMRKTLEQLDPKKIEKQIKSLELAEERNKKAVKAALEAQGIRAAKAEVKALIDETLVQAKDDAASAAMLREEAEQILEDAKSQYSRNAHKAKELDAREQELTKKTRALQVQQLEIENDRRKADDALVMAQKARTDAEARVERVKRRLSGLEE
jgi:isopropylmalate/homocitrate/citramalate synthase